MDNIVPIKVQQEDYGISLLIKMPDGNTMTLGLHRMYAMKILDEMYVKLNYKPKKTEVN